MGALDAGAPEREVCTITLRTILKHSVLLTVAIMSVANPHTDEAFLSLSDRLELVADGRPFATLTLESIKDAS